MFDGDGVDGGRERGRVVTRGTASAKRRKRGRDAQLASSPRLLRQCSSPAAIALAIVDAWATPRGIPRVWPVWHRFVVLIVARSEGGMRGSQAGQGLSDGLLLPALANRVADRVADRAQSETRHC